MVAAGIANVPVDPEQDVPTLISKAALPLLAVIDGDVAQNPDEMVGATFDQSKLVNLYEFASTAAFAVKVAAPLRETSVPLRNI